MTRIDEIKSAVSHLADENGIVADSFRTNHALEAAGFNRDALFAAWLAGEIEAPMVNGTYNHMHYKVR